MFIHAICALNNKVLQRMNLEFKITNVIFFIAFMLHVLCAGCNVAQPTAAITMDKEGMHRSLTYRIKFNNVPTEKDCEYIVDQPLPAAVYISTDELDDLQRLKKLNAIYPKFVDIELPTEKANEFRVLLRGVPEITSDIKLPIHFRYHAPSDKSTTATVTISTPVLYSNCSKGFDKKLELVDNEDKNYCLNEQTVNFIEQSRADSSNELCNWKTMQVNYELESPLIAEIPVGNSKTYPPILYVTIILSWVMSIWTVLRTHDIPRRINYRLNEQRKK